MAASLEKIDLPLTAQSTISVALDAPSASSIREQLGYNLVGAMLSKSAHNRLRGELALCYAATVRVNTITDQNYRRDKNWSFLVATASLNGQDAIAGLDALTNDVLQQPLDEKVLNTLLVGVRRDTDHALEGSPSMIADRVLSILTNSKRDEIEINELRDYAEDVSIDELRKLHRNIVDSKPLVLATSPDDAVLRAVGDWSSTV